MTKFPKIKTAIIFLTVFFGVLFFAKASLAAVNLPWSTTYDCPDWNNINDPLSCDGIDKGLGGAIYDTYYEQVISSANRTGSLGKGQRHWLLDDQPSPSTTFRENEAIGQTVLSVVDASLFVPNPYLKAVILRDVSETAPGNREIRMVMSTDLTPGTNTITVDAPITRSFVAGDVVGVLQNNNCSGGTVVYFSEGQSEIGVRWYMRYQAGFKWWDQGRINVGNKIMYFFSFNDGQPDTPSHYFSIDAAADAFDLSGQYGDNHHHHGDTGGWSNTFGGGSAVSDGSWHYIELHLKVGTAPAHNNHLVEWWVDGVLKKSFYGFYGYSGKFISGTATGGSNTTLIDTSKNFINEGVIVGNAISYFLWPYEDPGDMIVTGITTTTNPNDTLEFATNSFAFTPGVSYEVYINRAVPKKYGGFIIASNNVGTDNGNTPFYVDYDDITISNTGYIGPIGGTPDTTPPAAPTGVAVN